MLLRAGLTVFLVIKNMQKTLQNIIELPYSPQMLNCSELNQRHLLAIIFPPLGRIT